jgi:hypothetical protein
MKLFAQAMRVSVWLCGLPLRLCRAPLPRLLERYTPAARQLPSGSALDMQRLVQLVVWVCHWPFFRPPLFPRACLRQSLALYYVLSHRGYPVAIHFGVCKAADGLQGHSWVSVHGTPVAERPPWKCFMWCIHIPLSPHCQEDEAVYDRRLLWYGPAVKIL